MHRNDGRHHAGRGHPVEGRIDPVAIGLPEALPAVLDLRRIELEKTLTESQEGPAHDAAMNEYGDVLSELEHRDFYTAESRAESVLFGLGFAESDLHRDVAAGALPGGFVG